MSCRHCGRKVGHTAKCSAPGIERAKPAPRLDSLIDEYNCLIDRIDRASWYTDSRGLRMVARALAHEIGLLNEKAQKQPA